MDELQRKHLIDRLDLVMADVRQELLCEVEDEERYELEERIRELEDDVETLEDGKRDLESENDDLKDTIKKLQVILEDLASSEAGHDYVVEKANEALELI